MKKNFFKKLSFVLALAMIMSTIAPAGAFAATKKPKLNSAKEYLFLGSGNDEQYDFNVKNTVKGYKYKWTSADKAIATVNQSGVVTAKGIGTTKVSVVIKNKKGKEVSTLKASVIVKDNIASLKITGTPAGDKLAVGKENAFTYSYTTKSGSTSQTTSVVAWKVDKAGATVTEDGKFVATAAGTYKVTATAYQSKTTLAAGTSLATADYTVTVPNEIKTVTATKSNQLKVAFASAATAVDKANFTVTSGTNSNKLYVKAVTLSDDKTYATVDLYDIMVSGTTYTVAAKVDSADMKGEVKYVKGAPSKIVAATSQVAPKNTAYQIAYQVLDANGVDISADTLVSFQSANNAIISNAGTVTYTASGVVDYVYITYIDPATANQIKSDKIMITCVDKIASSVANYTLSTNNDASTDVNFAYPKTALDETSTGYFVRFMYKDQYNNERLATNYVANNITFEPLDTSIFVVDKTTGLVIPVKAGTGYFRIYVDGKLLDTKSLTVRADAKISSIKIKYGNSKNITDTGHVNSIDNNAWVQPEAFNQYNEEITGAPITFMMQQNAGLVSTDGGNTAMTSNQTITTGSAQINGVWTTVPFSSDMGVSISAKKGTSGGVAYAKVYLNSDPSIYTTVVFNVTKANNYETSVAVGFQYGGNTLDVNAKYDGNGDTNPNTILQVFATNSSTERVRKLTDASITITGPNGKVASGLTNANGDFAFDCTLDTYGKDWAYLAGTYTVVAKRNGVEVGVPFTFTVSDSGSNPTITLAANTVTGGVLNTTNLKSLLAGVGDDYTLIGFQYAAADSTIMNNPVVVSGDTSWLTSVSYSQSTLVYNVKVKLIKNINGANKIYVVTLPTSINLQN